MKRTDDFHQAQRKNCWSKSLGNREVPDRFSARHSPRHRPFEPGADPGEPDPDGEPGAEGARLGKRGRLEFSMVQGILSWAVRKHETDREISYPSLSKKIQHTNTCVFQCVQNCCLLRNCCWRHVLLPPNNFCILVILHVCCRFWNGEKYPTKRRKKSRAQNAEPETSKKTGNGENLGNRRYLLLFQNSSDNFAHVDCPGIYIYSGW